MSYVSFDELVKSPQTKDPVKSSGKMYKLFLLDDLPPKEEI